MNSASAGRSARCAERLCGEAHDLLVSTALSWIRAICDGRSWIRERQDVDRPDSSSRSPSSSRSARTCRGGTALARSGTGLLAGRVRRRWSSRPVRVFDLEAADEVDRRVVGPSTGAGGAPHRARVALEQVERFQARRRARSARTASAGEGRRGCRPTLEGGALRRLHRLLEVAGMGCVVEAAVHGPQQVGEYRRAAVTAPRWRPRPVRPCARATRGASAGRRPQAAASRPGVVWRIEQPEEWADHEHADHRRRRRRRGAGHSAWNQANTSARSGLRHDVRIAEYSASSTDVDLLRLAARSRGSAVPCSECSRSPVTASLAGSAGCQGDGDGASRLSS